MDTRPHDRMGWNQPPPVEAKHAREDVRQGADELREKLPTPQLKPTAEMPGLGSYSGPMELPGNPRYGDPNFGQNAWHDETGRRNEELDFSAWRQEAQPDEQAQEPPQLEQER